MPGAGKSTIGQKLANILHYGFIDSDYLIESLYARRLQAVTNSMSRRKFLDTEAQIICGLQASNCVVATGGSVIYREEAMRHLQRLGVIVYLELSLKAIEERIARNPERGISFGKNQTLADLYAERTGLYAKYAMLTCDTGVRGSEECARWIANQLKTGPTQ